MIYTKIDRKYHINLKLGFLLYFVNFLPDNISSKATSFRPSDRSSSRAVTLLFTNFKCSLAHLLVLCRFMCFSVYFFLHKFVYNFMYRNILEYECLTKVFEL